MSKVFRKPLKRLRHAVEYVGVRAGLWLIRVTPCRAAAALAAAIAGAAFAFTPKRRRVAVDNILRGGIAADPAEARRIARASYRHFAVLVVESLKAEQLIDEDNWRDFIEPDIPEDVMAAVQREDQGLILATAHLGNWEVAAQALSYLKPVTAVARRMNNPYTDGLIQNRKLGKRFRMLPAHQATGSALLKVLKDGEVLAMLVDQHARKRGMVIDFLGRPASTHTSRSRTPVS